MWRINSIYFYFIYRRLLSYLDPFFGNDLYFFIRVWSVRPVVERNYILECTSLLSLLHWHCRSARVGSFQNILELQTTGFVRQQTCWVYQRQGGCLKMTGSNSLSLSQFDNGKLLTSAALLGAYIVRELFNRDLSTVGCLTQELLIRCLK